MIDPQKILVLSPHTDDGELGCGGSIARYAAAGKEVHYAAFSLCAKSLPAALPADTLAHECKAATAVLGIPASQVTLFDFEVREFPRQRQAILEELVVLQKKIQPDLIFIPQAQDIHQDHGVIHQEALRAFKNTSVLGYEQVWNQVTTVTNLFIQLSEEALAKKAASLQCYQSQQQRVYMQAEFTRSLALVRGVQGKYQYAEAFEVYKMML